MIVQLDSSGAATTATNAITLLSLAPDDEGSIFYIINTGSNNISIAFTGTWKSPALNLDETEGATIVAPASNTFYAVGHAAQ